MLLQIIKYTPARAANTRASETKYSHDIMCVRFAYNNSRQRKIGQVSLEVVLFFFNGK